MKNKSIRQFVLIVAIALIVVPYFLPIRYTILAADDFNVYNLLEKYGGVF